MQKLLISFCGALALIAATAGLPAMAGQRAAVEPFYEFLSDPTSEKAAAAVRATLAEDWKSIGDYSGRTKSADAFVKQVSGFGKLIPDLRASGE